MSRRRARPELIARRGELTVERDPRRPGGRLLRAHGMDASYVDLADARHLEFSYLRWIREVLVLVGARRILHIGGAGCALARAMLAADADRDARHEVCEVSGEVLALAREHLGLRRIPGLRVRELDGRLLLARRPRDAYDAVVIDAFVGARVPDTLVSVEALADVARVAPVALVNVLDGRGRREVGRVAAGLASAYPQVAALTGRGANTVLVAGAARLELGRLAARVGADPEPGRVHEPDELARLITGASLRPT